MKLSTWAKKSGISYKTAWRLWKDGKLDAFTLPTGTIIVNDLIENKFPDKVCIYARVSSSENKNNLDARAQRLENYAIAKGYSIYKIVKETGSGVDDNRKQLNKLFIDKNYNTLIVEHKDRLTRFGFNYINILFNELGKHIEVVNETDNDKNDLMQDMISIVTSMCARYYGLRKGKRKRDKIVEVIKNESD